MGDDEEKNIKLIAQDVSIISGICNFVRVKESERESLPRVFKRLRYSIKCIMNNNVRNINK